ncbi:MAG: hypothetical protein RDU25_05215 [Patescibacteria group bacterium]|nr:hypothetical protein [Patescibacteria group bacterium]
MPITAEQKNVIKKILVDYHQRTRQIVHGFRHKAVKAVEEVDRRKVQGIKEKIQSV